MYDSRLYQLVEQLSPKISSDLSIYLKNTTNPKNKDLSLLYEQLQGNLATAKSKLSKVKVYQSIYPKSTYNDQKWRLLCSQLLKRIEAYIVSQRTSVDSPEYHLSLLQYYREQELKSHYESQLKRTIKYFENSDKQDSNFHDQRVYLEDEISSHLLGQTRNQDLNIQSTLDQTDVSYLIKKLKFACSALAHRSVYNIEYDFGLLDLIESEIESTGLLRNNPALDLYYTCYQMLLHPENLEQFDFYRNKLSAYQKIFDKTEIRNLYLLGINMCIRRLNKGEKQFGKIGLEMYEEALKAKHLLINGKLSRYTYRNIAMMAIRSDDFQWADYFTETYKEYLKKGELLPSYHLNKALIHYYKEELEAARDNIIEADFKDPLINLATKTLLAKIYHQLHENMLLESHLDSMEMYIIRRKIIGNHKQNYKNFISNLRKLNRLKPYDLNKRERLVSKISSEQILTEKKWFLSQLEK
jgi:hypothetical protein